MELRDLQWATQFMLWAVGALVIDHRPLSTVNSLYFLARQQAPDSY